MLRSTFGDFVIYIAGLILGLVVFVLLGYVSGIWLLVCCCVLGTDLSNFGLFDLFLWLCWNGCAAGLGFVGEGCACYVH